MGKGGEDNLLDKRILAVDVKRSLAKHVSETATPSARAAAWLLVNEACVALRSRWVRAKALLLPSPAREQKPTHPSPKDTQTSKSDVHIDNNAAGPAWARPLSPFCSALYALYAGFPVAFLAAGLLWGQGRTSRLGAEHGWGGLSLGGWEVCALSSLGISTWRAWDQATLLAVGATAALAALLLVLALRWRQSSPTAGANLASTATSEETERSRVVEAQPFSRPLFSTVERASPGGGGAATATEGETERRSGADIAKVVPVPEHLWLVHGRLYDLRPFVNQHPGGSWAILLGQGRDCTALFESYHPFTDKHRTVLAQYVVSEPAPLATTAPSSVQVLLSPTAGAVAAAQASTHKGGGVGASSVGRRDGVPSRQEADPFYNVLCSRVRDVLREQGMDPLGEGGRGKLKASKGRLLYYASVVVGLAYTYPRYSTGGGGWRFPSAAVLFALLSWLAGAMGHDGSHFTCSSRPFLNKLGTLGMMLIASPFMWMHQHTFAHHSFTNDVDLDPDLHHFSFLRTHPQCPWTSRYKAQAYRVYVYVWYAFVVFGEALWLPLNTLLNGDINGIVDVPQAFTPIGRCCQLCHLVVYLWAIVWRPVALQGVTYGLTSALVFLASTGLLFGFFSQINHLNLPSMKVDSNSNTSSSSSSSSSSSGSSSSSSSSSSSYAQTSTSGSFGSTAAVGDTAATSLAVSKGQGWAVEQVETSNNFCVDSWLWSWLSNGLNLQIEHHLFPSINHQHLWRISGVVRRTCEEHGVRYKSFESVSSVLAETAEFYRHLAQADSIVSRPAAGAAATAATAAATTAE